MNLLWNEQINKNAWMELLGRSRFASPFQTPEFHEIFNLSDKRYYSEVWAIEKDQQLDTLVVVTFQRESGIRSFFSRRAIIYGGPLLNENSYESLSFLLKNLNNIYRKKVIYIEIRNYFDYSTYDYIFQNASYNRLKWFNYVLDTSSYDIVKKNISESRWRQIKKSLNNGTYWREAKNEQEVLEFYKILLNLYKYKINKPLPPEELFIRFYHKNLGKLLLVINENKIIGGILCPIFENKVIYEYYIVGLDKEYKNLYPSVMATWAAIEYALNNNIPVFDFMGAGSPDSNYGVREFKQRFGGNLVEYGRYIVIFHPYLFKIGKIGLNFLSYTRTYINAQNQKLHKYFT